MAHFKIYSQTCLKRPLSKRPQLGFHDQLSLNASQKYCWMLKGSILQYFRPSLSKIFILSIFSGRFTQLLLQV